MPHLPGHLHHLSRLPPQGPSSVTTSPVLLINWTIALLEISIRSPSFSVWPSLRSSGVTLNAEDHILFCLSVGQVSGQEAKNNALKKVTFTATSSTLMWTTKFDMIIYSPQSPFQSVRYLGVAGETRPDGPSGILHPVSQNTATYRRHFPQVWNKRSNTLQDLQALVSVPETGSNVSTVFFFPAKYSFPTGRKLC